MQKGFALSSVGSSSQALGKDWWNIFLTLGKSKHFLSRLFQFKWALGKETSYAIQRVYRLWRKKGNPFISISMSVCILSLRYCVKRTLKLAHFDIHVCFIISTFFFSL